MTMSWAGHELEQLKRAIKELQDEAGACGSEQRPKEDSGRTSISLLCHVTKASSDSISNRTGTADSKGLTSASQSQCETTLHDEGAVCSTQLKSAESACQVDFSIETEDIQAEVCKQLERIRIILSKETSTDQFKSEQQKKNNERESRNSISSCVACLSSR